MENRLDELFKNKLEHHAAPPSGNAWQRIEGSLAKKNNTFAAWRIAAGVLLAVGLITVMYWSQRSPVESGTQLSQRKAEEQPAEKIQPVTEDNHKPAPSIASAKRERYQSNRSPSEKQEKVRNSKLEAPVSISSDESANPIQEVTLANEGSAAAEVTAEIAQVAQVTKTEKPIVLEFTLAPVTTEVTAQAEEKSNGFKKLFSKARDLKNGESGLDLSDLTTRLFASNQKQPKDNIN